MVATKILATINQTGSSSPSKQLRSSSFDHTSTSRSNAAPSAAVSSTPVPASSTPASAVSAEEGADHPPSIGTSSVTTDAAPRRDPPAHPSSSLTTRTGTNEPSAPDTGSSSTSDSSYGDYWTSAKNYAAQTYDRFASSTSTSTSTGNSGVASSGPDITTTSTIGEEEDFSALSSLQQGVSNLLSSLYVRSYTSLNDLAGGDVNNNMDADQEGQLIMPASEASPVNNNNHASAVRRGPPIELRWLTRNPYNIVSGRHNLAHSDAPSSMDAVRSLLAVVPSQIGLDIQDEEYSKKVRFHDIQQPKLVDKEEELAAVSADKDGENTLNDNQNIALSESMTSAGSADAAAQFPGLRPSSGSSRVSDAETASRLAEGTIRALRDLALEEAVELHSALRFWSERWERPVLSWLEAGPTVWLSREGYNHQVVGKKVSQIQAVLARRCTSVGELQEHLLRAGWQRGVQQWGVLGQGGQWATVAGGDGIMDGDSSQRSLQVERADSSLSRESSVGAPKDGSMRDYYSLRASMINENSMRILSPQNRRRSTYYGQADVFVRNTRGGRIERDDPALAAWTVDAMRVIRDQLYKAGNRSLQLPCFENWRDEVEHFARASNEPTDHAHIDPATTPIRFVSTESLPLWATEDVSTSTYHSPDRNDTEGRDHRRTRFQAANIREHNEPHFGEPPCMDPDEDEDEDGNSDGMEEEVARFIQGAEGVAGDVVISDLPLFAQEISSLLDSMEVLMQNQRRRRLLKLKPPPRIKRQWYVASVVAPAVSYIAIKLFNDGYIKGGLHWVAEQAQNFYNEHLSGPIRSIYGELVKGKPDVTDKKARLEAIATLKNMIGSWLDETFPKMSEDEKINIADSMDISLVEKAKEESIKRSVFEINNIVRLSMIEMQFIKKELMSALVAMDELMSSNEINAKIAAMTPAFILLYGTRSIFRFCFYFLLKFGKSREETYQTFRHIILDIERLLTMRDNPPDAPPPLSGSLPSVSPRRSIGRVQPSHHREGSRGNVLDPNDLGMLMLHVHECRKLLWEDRRRFSSSEMRNVTEDLAELAGERGPVSVQQQLAIISRMCRTYSFLKVISTGHSFDFAFRSIT